MKMSISEVDDKFLLMVDSLYETYSKNSEDDFFDELPKEVQDLLELSRKEADQGKLTSHQTIREKYRKKFDVSE
ncbi:hypothetical protein LB456_05235 [Psychroflexus sp. CAK57W]|uniref:hypothetical protein n=1 Tax=Psychroflexus curvus TaxID=2873595 RepID=UPI001CC9DF0E|nr:hypothetical protein [Psychroflexus curvus]MBZ9628771.1 hypothetical protein [Psychroflexus curvus]MBZ9786855.1 hypothetical protein [Psychroflexus curvus]